MKRLNGSGNVITDKGKKYKHPNVRRAEREALKVIKDILKITRPS